MNTNSLPTAFLPHVSMIPRAVVHTTFRRHPMFFWHKRHFRSVRCELVIDPCSGLLKTEYTDERTGDTFTNKQSAEYYLRQEIPENEHEGKLYVEKERPVYAYYVCLKCGCMKCGCAESLLMDMIFLGPADIVSGSIKTTTYRICPNCGRGSVKMDVSTEPTPPSNLKDQDCDLAR